METASPPQFACDAMLGGLARWLRAAGYDSFWQAGIDDWDLIRLAQREGRILLSSDTGIFRIGIVRDGDLPALFIPHELLTKESQLAFVLQKLSLEPRPPRCMACGGPLIEVPKAQVQDRAPPRTYARVDCFFECGRCGQLFWEGTHWRKIAAVLEQVRAGAGSSGDMSEPEA
jgi:uncharacterized protein with PIN domain